MTTPPPASSVETVRHGANLLEGIDAPVTSVPLAKSEHEEEVAPTSTMVAATVVPISRTVVARSDTLPPTRAGVEHLAARLMAVLAHSAVIIGLILVGRRHFGDYQLGIAMAALYLLLPCTAYDVHKVNHVLPAALITWAFVAYRKPMIAGGLLGLACGTLFFAVFLLPLWVAFYGRRDAVRFGAALVLVAVVLMGTLVLTSADTNSLTQKLIGTINWSSLQFQGSDSIDGQFSLSGVMRIPLVAAFGVMLVMLTIWPRQKNFEVLLSHSTAIIVATQLWYPRQPGVYLLWYLPMLLLVVFRPRLNRLLPPAIDNEIHDRIRGSQPADLRLPAVRGSIRTTLYR